MLNIDTATCASLGAPFIATPQDLRCWYAVHVRHNFEGKVLGRLAAHGVETFLPSYTSVRQWHDRKVRLDLPLFPGYLFVRIDWSRKLQVISQTGVIAVVGGPSASIDDETISRLQLAVSLKAAAPYEAPACQPGERVRIVHGPFRGAEGILDRQKGHSRVILSIASVERRFVLEVAQSDIQLA